jgi:hypothetical protein
MGKEKQSSSGTTVVNQTTTPTPTPEETRLNQLQIQATEATQPQLIQAQQSGLNLINQLLTGQEQLPGFFTQLGQGISPQITNDIVQQSLRDIMPSFQQSGIIDSGVAASIAGRTAGDIRRASEEFNIGNRLNLLNLALSGQAQVQAPILGQAEVLGSRLAGLRSVNTQGTTTQNTTQYGMNPFMKSFQTQAGKTLGGGQVGFNWNF